MKIIDCLQYTDAWWRARRGIPTASDFSDIITAAKAELSASASKYICQLIADLSDERYGRHEDYVSAAMKNGTQMEPEARAWYCFERNSEVQQVGFCIADDGRAGCSPDALVGDDGGLELKSPLPKTHIGYLLAGVLPDAYKQQVHACMAITERKWWDFASYVPGFPPFLIRVEWSEYTDKLVDAMEKFHAAYAVAFGRMKAMGWEPVPMLDPEPVHSSRDAEGLAMRHEDAEAA